MTCYLIQFRIVIGCLMNSVRLNNWFNSIIVQHTVFYRQLYDWVNWTLFSLVIWFNSIIVQHNVFYRQLYDWVNWSLFCFALGNLIHDIFCTNRSSFFIIIMNNISLFIKLLVIWISAEDTVAVTLSHSAVLFSHVLAYVQWEPFTYTSKFST